MFIAIAQFSQIKAGRDAEFIEWFAWSNQEFATFKGFFRRRLLKPSSGFFVTQGKEVRIFTDGSRRQHSIEEKGSGENINFRLYGSLGIQNAENPYN